LEKDSFQKKIKMKCQFLSPSEPPTFLSADWARILISQAVGGEFADNFSDTESEETFSDFLEDSEKMRIEEIALSDFLSDPQTDPGFIVRTFYFVLTTDNTIPEGRFPYPRADKLADWDYALLRFLTPYRDYLIGMVAHSFDIALAVETELEEIGLMRSYNCFIREVLSAWGEILTSRQAGRLLGVYKYAWKSDGDWELEEYEKLLRETRIQPAIRIQADTIMQLLMEKSGGGENRRKVIKDYADIIVDNLGVASQLGGEAFWSEIAFILDNTYSERLLKRNFMQVFDLLDTEEQKARLAKELCIHSAVMIDEQIPLEKWKEVTDLVRSRIDPATADTLQGLIEWQLEDMKRKEAKAQVAAMCCKQEEKDRKERTQLMRQRVRRKKE
jgi:hypothetical protein